MNRFVPLDPDPASGRQRILYLADYPMRWHRPEEEGPWSARTFNCVVCLQEETLPGSGVLCWRPYRGSRDISSSPCFDDPEDGSQALAFMDEYARELELLCASFPVKGARIQAHPVCRSKVSGVTGHIVALRVPHYDGLWP